MAKKARASKKAKRAAKKKSSPSRKKPKPRKPLTPTQTAKLVELAHAQCQDATIAKVLGIALSTFRVNYSERAAGIRLHGKADLRVAQFRAALQGDRTMLVWLGKQYLGQTDKTDLSTGGEPLKAYLHLGPGDQ